MKRHHQDMIYTLESTEELGATLPVPRRRVVGTVWRWMWWACPSLVQVVARPVDAGHDS